jgi:hypothetical protein
MQVQDQTTYDQQIAAKKAKDAGEAVGPDGRPIPNAGVYGQQQAQAELDWQNSNTASAAKLKSYQNQEGVLADGSVDPRNTYGGYQQLLHQQGSELDQASQDAMGRGLGGGPGLGNQAERGLRFGHAVQNLGFQRGLSDAQANYGMELGQNDATRRNAMTAALQNALNNAWGDWTPPEMQQEDSNGDGVPDPVYTPKGQTILPQYAADPNRAQAAAYSTSAAQKALAARNAATLAQMKKVTQPAPKAATIANRNFSVAVPTPPKKKK